MELNREQRRSKVKQVNGLPLDSGRYPSRGEMVKEDVKRKKEGGDQQGQSKKNLPRHGHK